MRLYFVVVFTDGNRNAVAAFSQEDRAQAFIRERELPEARVDFAEFKESSEFVPRIVFAAHRRNDDELYELAGYYLTVTEAVAAFGENGYQEILEVDSPPTRLLFPWDREREEAEKAAAEAAALAANEKTPEQLERERIEAEELAAKEAALQSPIAGKSRYATKATKKARKPEVSERIGDIRKLIAACAALLVIIIANIYLIFFPSGPQIAENVDMVKWLPESATDISYYKSKRFLVFEAAMPEPEWVEWVERAGADPQAIRNPFSVVRYSFYLDELPGMEGLDEEAQMVRWAALTKVTIENGLGFDIKQTGSGTRMSGGYDRDRKRGYFHRIER